MDALVYAKTKNIMTNDDLRYTGVNFSSGGDSLSLIQQANQYLDETTIKRACCMNRDGPNKGDNSKGVNVKIPIPTGFDVNSHALNPATNNQFGYIEKTVFVPSSLCKPEWKKNTPYCDSFMATYCSNEYKAFTQMLDGQTDNGGIWTQYLKECSCYAPPNPSFGSAAKNCYMFGCKGGDTGVYLSPDSRDSNGNPLTCDMTICNSIVSASDITAGGSSTISPTIVQQCGQELNTAIQKKKQQDAAEAAAKAAAAAAAAAAAKAASDAAAAKAKADADATSKAEAAAAAKSAADAKAASDKAKRDAQIAAAVAAGESEQEAELNLDKSSNKSNNIIQKFNKMPKQKKYIVYLLGLFYLCCICIICIILIMILLKTGKKTDSIE